MEAYREYFSGYGQDALALLDDPVVDDVSGYDDMILLKDVPLVSHCEHHIAPLTGKAFVAYRPGRRVTGLSRLARVGFGIERRSIISSVFAENIVGGIPHRPSRTSWLRSHRMGPYCRS